MRPKQFLALALILLWLAQDAALARSAPASVRWSELAPLVVDKRVGLRLPDGCKIEGDVLAVREQELALDVTKSSNKKLHPRGQAAIPRASVSELRVIKTSGPGRLVGGLLGSIGGIMGTGALGVATESAALVLTGLFVVVPVAAVAGYYLGKAADRRSTRILIAPEAVAPEAAE